MTCICPKFGSVFFLGGESCGQLHPSEHTQSRRFQFDDSRETRFPSHTMANEKTRILRETRLVTLAQY